MKVSLFRTPQDYERYPEFRRLIQLVDAKQREAKVKVPPEMISNFLFFRLWSELSYSARTERLGVLTEWNMDQLSKETALPFKDFEQLMVDSKLLKKCNGYYFCFLFHTCNLDLSRDYDAPVLKAQEARLLNAKIRKFKEEAPKLVSQLPQEYSHQVDGIPVSPEEMNKIIVLVHVLDSIFGREARKVSNYEVGLFQDGARIIRSFSDLQLQISLQRLLAKRMQHDVPHSAEKCMAIWKDLMDMIRPEEGWGNWSLVMVSGKNEKGEDVTLPEPVNDTNKTT